MHGANDRFGNRMHSEDSAGKCQGDGARGLSGTGENRETGIDQQGIVHEMGIPRMEGQR